MKYKYDLIRSERRSITVSISDDNKITVRCPWSMRLEKIEEFLRSKQKWIDKVVMQNSYRLARNDDVLEFRKIYVDGRTLPLEIGAKNGIFSDKVCVKSLADVEKVFITRYAEEFYARVRELSALTRLTPSGVSLRRYKGRWGCCDAQNHLTFNYLLFMLPAYMRDYVIVHELCHTLCRNHSPAFWKLVSDYVPDYRKIRAEMKEFTFLVTLY